MAPNSRPGDQVAEHIGGSVRGILVITDHAA